VEEGVMQVIVLAPTELHNFLDTECCRFIEIHRKEMRMLWAVFLFRPVPATQQMAVK
jgi:hypothetical protein